jgi:hypothetical protein
MFPLNSRLNDYLGPFWCKTLHTSSAPSRTVNGCIEREKLWLKKAYLEKFGKILPPKKVMRYSQLENKVAVMGDYQIIQEVPLAK